MNLLERIPPGTDRHTTVWHWAILGLLVFLFALKFHLLFLQNINWDEFLYLARVHDALRGDLSGVLQSGHVHAFVWLPWVPDSEVDQIIAARVVMFALQIGTCGFIFGIARKLFDSPAAAVLGIFAYLSFAYIVDHGTAFRADPIAVFLLMGALWLLVRDRGGWFEIVSAGVLTALAGLVTIKSVFYAPTLALAILCLRGDANTRQRLSELFTFAATALTVFVILYFAHRHSLDAAQNYSATDMVSRSTDKAILFDRFFPRKPYLSSTLRHDSLAWIMLLTGFIVAAGVAMIRKNARRAAGLAGLALPLVTLVFYRNAFPYYYVFVLAAPVVLVTGLIVLTSARPLAWYFQAAGISLIALLALNMFDHYSLHNIDRIVAQRQLIETVHRMFPQPVPYIDRSSIISSFPKAGFFMSTWGMENYRVSGRPVMRTLLMQQKPPFLITNHQALMLDRKYQANPYALLPEDFEVLRDNFVPHWGEIWVAGKHLDLAKADTEYLFEILVPGTYTVESEVALVIDGIGRMPGAHVELGPGFHSASSRQPLKATLRWGTDLYRPGFAPASDPIFIGF